MCEYAHTHTLQDALIIQSKHTHLQRDASITVFVQSSAPALTKFNKARYTATLVTRGWAGAVFELLEPLGKCSEAKDRKNIKK